MNRAPHLKCKGRRPRSWLLGAFGALAALLFVACSPVNAEGPQSPTELKPSTTTVLALASDFSFPYLPGARVRDLEWDIEIEYNTRDVRAVFDHYDEVLTGLGFDQRVMKKDHVDEIEAEYRSATTDVWVELEVELDDGRVEVDLEFEDPHTYEVSDVIPPFSLLEFMGWEIPVYADATVYDVEWDFGFFHPGEDPEEVFEHYDGVLQDNGWAQTSIDNDDHDEWEADYRQNGVHLELEVEAESGGAEVEIELNKLRFYQGQN